MCIGNTLLLPNLRILLLSLLRPAHQAVEEPCCLGPYFARPTASGVNFVPGQTVPNRVIAKLGPMGKSISTNLAGNVDVVIDVGGWFTDSSSGAGGSHFVGIAPTRLLDTRNGFGPMGPGEMVTLSFNGPGAPAITAVVINVTVVNTTVASFMTVWPDGEPLPTASDLK